MILLPEISVGDLSNTGIKMEQYMVERLVSCKLDGPSLDVCSWYI